MNDSAEAPNFVVLAILDGWGIAAEGPGNAITQAKTVNMDKFRVSYPHTTLQASGQAVGLPRGEDGNTETGHINLGAGRIVYQDLERINMSIADGSFYNNQVLLGAVDHAKKNNSNLHIMGLVGAGGVHSNLDHLFALLNLTVKQGFNRTYVHIFTDGRDSPPTSAKTYVNKLGEVLQRDGSGKIASIMGRYWAMDRDQRWDRTEKAYIALTKAVGNHAASVEEAIEKSYSEGKTDEFIEPTIIIENGKPVSVIEAGDSVIFFNFRIDRPRQLTKAFILPDFSKAQIVFDEPFRDHDHPENRTPATKPFRREKPLEKLYFVTMTDYGKTITDAGAKVAFPPEIIDTPVSSVISAAEMKQLKITESEKERFVTFYFNGLREQSFINEDRLIIPSPKVPTYDQKPEMSTAEVLSNLLKKMSGGTYKFALVNFPNPDMVGHTGNIGAAVKACEAVDDAIGKLANFALAYGGALLVTADHGNVEEMINVGTGEIDTEHSVNPVPFMAIYRNYLGKAQMLPSGILADVAPTILGLLNIPIPTSMTGRNLLEGLAKS